MKNLLNDFYVRLGAILGITERQDADALRSVDDMAKAREVFSRLRRLQDEWRNEGVTPVDVRSWVREGRQ